MAINRADRYPGRWEPANADYPLGGPKNRTSPTSKDGSYFEKDWIADYEAFFQRLIIEGGISVNETPDTAPTSQFYDALTASVNKLVSSQAENRFKGNQNPVVKGKDGHPLPDSTKRDYPAGDEIAAGIIAFTNVVNLTYVNGVYSADSGILRRRYAKDAAGLITKNSQYGCVKLPDGSQLQALVDDIATNGVRITEDGSDVVVDVDLSVLTSGFRFHGLSDERGALADINDDESFISAISSGVATLKPKDVTGSRTPGVEFENTLPVPINVSITTISTTTALSRTLTRNGITNNRVSPFVSGQIGTSVNFDFEVEPGGTYEIDLFFTKWIESGI